MAERKDTSTEAPERDRYTEPREKADPEHKDAGQLYVEQHPADEDNDEAERKN